MFESIKSILIILLMGMTVEARCTAKAFIRNLSKQKISAGVKTFSKSLIQHKYKTGAALVVAGCISVYFKHHKRRAVKTHLLKRVKAVHDRFNALTEEARILPAKRCWRARGEQELSQKMQNIVASLSADESSLENYSLQQILACINRDTATQTRLVMFSTFLTVCENYLVQVEAVINKIKEINSFDRAIKPSALTGMHAENKRIEDALARFNADLSDCSARLKELDGRWRAWAQRLLWDHLSKSFGEKLEAKIEQAQLSKNQNVLDSLNSINNAWKQAMRAPSNESSSCQVCIIMARESHIFS